jgi:hypothetical protein
MKTVNLTEEEHAELLALRAKNKTKASAPSPQDVVRAAGTSEGAKKGWEKRQAADKLSSIAESHQGGVLKEQMKAHDAHSEAAHAHFNAHWEAKNAGDSEGADKHWAKMNEHYEKSRKFKTFSGGNSLGGVMASEVTTGLAGEVIHCRSHASAAGSVLAADKAWNPGEPVEFMWMPAGTHTICAGFRNGSIELTVNCDENTAANVQASLDAWRTERPKQEPFGCVEHREHEASVRVSAQQAFTFKNDGVYIAAEPTMLGAQNVNGKVHRSWSPSFTTDADYSQAKTVKTASGATVMVFPEGVRGSRSNPAEITGVDFCVGTLTNKPAFHAMSPVKGSEVSLTVTLADGEVIKYDSGGATVLASGASDSVKATWSDEARKASAEARKRHGLDGAKFEHTPEHFTKNARYHEAMAEHHEEEHRLQPTDRREADTHAELADMHNRAAFHYEHAAKAAKKGLHDLSGNHLRSAERYGIDADDYYSGPAKASEAKGDDALHAHCHATLLQDVPDATPAEIACYEKCLDEGGSHVTAVAEIKAQRKPEHVTQTAKASAPVTPDTILARQQAALDAANELAASKGVARKTVEEVYAKLSGEPVKATWSDAARKAAKDPLDLESIYARAGANR